MFALCNDTPGFGLGDCDVVGSSDRCFTRWGIEMCTCTQMTQYERNYKYYMDISIEDVFLAVCVRVTCNFVVHWLEAFLAVCVRVTCNFVVHWLEASLLTAGR